MPPFATIWCNKTIPRCTGERRLVVGSRPFVEDTNIERHRLTGLTLSASTVQRVTEAVGDEVVTSHTSATRRVEPQRHRGTEKTKGKEAMTVCVWAPCGAVAASNGFAFGAQLTTSPLPPTFPMWKDNRGVPELPRHEGNVGKI